MSKILNCIMLIDDNPDDNFFHERVIRKYNFARTIIIKQSAIDALEYLKSTNRQMKDHPDLIFLDINMPKMNGWEFLNEYYKLDKVHHGSTMVVMLTTSESPYDKQKRDAYQVQFQYKCKPLTRKMLQDIITENFPDIKDPLCGS